MPDTHIPSEAVDAGEAAPQASGWTADDAIALTRSAARFGLSPDLVGELRQRGLSVDAARDALIDAAAERSERFQTRSQRAEVGHSYDDPQSRAERLGEGLFTRMCPGHVPSGPAREFASLTIPEMAKLCLEHAGIRTRGMSHGAILTRSLHTTSDFPAALGNTVYRVLKAEFEAAPRGIAQAARPITLADFRARAMIDFAGDPIELLEVNEGGEFLRATIAEGSNSIRLRTFGRVIGFTRQVLINDDLDMISRLPRMFAKAAVAVEDKTLAALLESNPTLGDGTALFHANHANLAGAGATISETTLSAARLALRTQVGLNGQPVNLVPWSVVIPPQLETATEKELAVLTPASSSDANPFQGALKIIVDPWLTSASAWYVAASPERSDGLLLAHLEGEVGPQIESRVGFDVDGVEIKARLDFGCGFVDHRSWFKNPG